jgi:hypothetical protein
MRPSMPLSRFYSSLPVLALFLSPHGGQARDCAASAPDYVAERSVTIGNATIQMRILSSGEREREEAKVGGKIRVTLRTPAGSTMFDPEARRGVEMPSATTRQQPTRYVDSAEPDGRMLRVTQFLRNGDWIDLSRTTCRKDGVMIRREFVTINAQGREVKGEMVQDHIVVGAISNDMFIVPGSVILERSNIDRPPR